MSGTNFDIEVNLRSLGHDEAKVALELAAMHASTATAEDASRILGDRRKGHEVVRRLSSKGWLQRTSRGHYAFLPPDWGAEKVEDFDLFLLASSSVDVGYIGWWAAASRHGFTTQVPQVIHVATDRQVAPREIQGNPVRYVKLAPRKFFGWEDMASSGRTFRVSGRAKTAIDCVDRPDLCGGPTELAQILSRAADVVPSGELIDTAIRFGSVSACQRLGYLLDLTSAPGSFEGCARERLRGFIPPSARSVFGRKERGERDVGYVPSWGLFVHAEEADLLSEVSMHRRAGR